MEKILFAALLGLAAMTSATMLEFGPEIIVTNAGNDTRYIEHQPILNFTDVTQLCTTGVWIAYTGPNYSFGEGGGTISIHPYLNYFCRSPASSRLGSTRFAGTQSYTKPSVTLFSKVDFGGDSLTVVDDLAHLDFETYSLVTIYTSVEFFQDINFGGESICLHINPATCYGEVCWLWDLYPEQLPWGTAARSAKVGCGVHTKVHMTFTDKGQNPVTHKEQ